MLRFFVIFFYKKKYHPPAPICCNLKIGGGGPTRQKSGFDGSQLNSIVVPKYKNRKKEFLILESVLTLHIDPQNLKITIKIVAVLLSDLPKLMREGHLAYEKGLVAIYALLDVLFSAIHGDEWLFYDYDASAGLPTLAQDCQR